MIAPLLSNLDDTETPSHKRRRKKKKLRKHISLGTKWEEKQILKNQEIPIVSFLNVSKFLEVL